MVNSKWNERVSILTLAECGYVLLGALGWVSPNSIVIAMWLTVMSGLLFVARARGEGGGR